MRTFIALSVILLFLSQALSQERLDMDKAVGLALDQNHNLRGASQDLASSRWGKLNAITNFLPKVDVSSSYTRIDPETELRANAALDFIRLAAGTLGIPPAALADLKPFAYRETFATELTVIQPVYNGGAEILGVRFADALQDKSEYAYQDTEQDVIARVKTSYLNVLKAEELVALTTEASERTRRYLEMIRRRASVGQRTQTDVLRWEVQLASDEGNIINAENMLAVARLQLNDVMGVDLEKHYALEKIAAADSGVAQASPSGSVMQFALLRQEHGIEPLDASFLESHPAMKTMETNLRLADLNISKSWVNFQPRVNLAFQYGWEKNNTLSLDGIRPWALALSVSFPIFNGFGDYTNLQKANADYRRTEEQVESYRRGLLMQATNARLNVKSTHKRMEIARKGQQEALDVLNSVSRRYESGGASNVDLIDVQTAYTQAKTSYITAVYDNFIAEVQLARALGSVAR